MPRHRTDNFEKNNLRLIIIKLMVERGNDPKRCGLCGAEGKTVIHHLKYDGSTIGDLRFACSKCNNAKENKGLT